MTSMNKIRTVKSIHWLMLMTMLNLSILSPVLQAARLDLDAPSISLSGQENEYIQGEGYRVQAVVTDGGQIVSVSLKVRAAGSGGDFQTIAMTATSGDVYVAIVPESLATSADLEYYIEARDKAGNITQAPYPSKPKVLAKAVGKPKAASVAKTTPVFVPSVIEQPVVQEQSTASDLPELGKTEVANAPVEPKKGSGTKYILWGVLGALVIGGLAGGGGGGSGGGGDTGASSGGGVVDVAW